MRFALLLLAGLTAYFYMTLAFAHSYKVEQLRKDRDVAALMKKEGLTWDHATYQNANGIQINGKMAYIVFAYFEKDGEVTCRVSAVFRDHPLLIHTMSEPRLVCGDNEVSAEESGIDVSDSEWRAYQIFKRMFSKLPL